jgi:hypothetical protein
MHKTFGEGVVIKQINGIMTIKFAIKTADFRYPDAFNGFLLHNESKVQAKLLREIAENDEKRQQLRAAREVKVAVNLPQPQAPPSRQNAPVSESHAAAPSPEEVLRSPAKPAAAKESKPANAEPKATASRKSKEPKDAAPQRPRKTSRHDSIAFKCTYCDGGKSDVCIGYRGICSDETIHHNVIDTKKPWCSSKESQCSLYVEGKLSRAELEEKYEQEGLCYECNMLATWKAAAGYGEVENESKPRVIRKVSCNSLSVLTTRSPVDETEENRYIFAVFLIDDFVEGDGKKEGYVASESEFRLALTPDEAKEMFFWKYYSNENNPTQAKWGSGLFRYFSNEKAAQILRDIAKLKKGSPDEDLANRFVLHFCKVNNIDLDALPEPNGIRA